MPKVVHKAALWSLIMGAVGVALVATGVSILLLYRTVYVETLKDIQGSTETLAGLMEAVAQFDIRHSAGTNPKGSWGASMSQIEQGLREHKRVHATEELTIALREGDTIRVLRRSPESGEIEDAAKIPVGSRLAEPLQRALRGDKGSATLVDYRGIPVLAGYAPVPSLGIAVVYKIDLAEVRAPYLRAAFWTGVTALLAIALGALSYSFFIRPFLREARQSQEQLRTKQRALLESEARLKEAQRLAKVGSWELDLATYHLVWSDEIFRMFEVDQSRFGASYDAFLDAIHPDDRDRVNKAYTDSLKTREPYEIVHRLKLADGRIKYVRETCESYFDSSGKPLRSVGTVQDISELHKAELELRQHREHLEELVQERTARLAESERLLRRAQEIAGLGHWSVNLVSGELEWSDEIFRIFGRDSETFKPSYENFFACVHPDDRASVKASEERSFQTGHHSIDHRVMHPDGSIRWVHEEAQLETDASGKPLRLTGTVQDITNRKQDESALRRAKEDAERANQAKSEFLSRMSHELRTPMNAILGFAQVLELERLRPEQTEYVHEIYRAGEHLLELINELLDLSRIEAGKLATVTQPVNIRSIVDHAIQINQKSISERKIVLLNKCNELATGLADPTRLKQILVNLLSNAAKYNRAGGRILIDCHGLDGEWLRLSVTDTGEGIPEEKMQSLFTPFERLGAEFSAVDGAGIGLALSKQLAELMGGKLGFDSTHGEGTTFWVDLPVVAVNSRPPATTAPAHSTPPETDRITALYIEDNPANLKVVEAMLRHRPNLRLLSAVNGEFGIELAKRYRPDVILLDIHLPGMDGYAVIDILKGDPSTRDIPIIALSADAMPIDIEKGLEAGFTDYLTKPLKVGALMAVLDRCLRPEWRNSSPGYSGDAADSGQLL